MEYNTYVSASSHSHPLYGYSLPPSKYSFALPKFHCRNKVNNVNIVSKCRSMYTYSDTVTNGKNYADKSLLTGRNGGRNGKNGGLNHKLVATRHSGFRVSASASTGNEELSTGKKAKLIAQRMEEFELEEMERPLGSSRPFCPSRGKGEWLLHSTSFLHGIFLHIKLEGSPIVTAQNDKFSASMENNVVWKPSERSTTARLLVSDTTIEVNLVIPPAFTFVSVDAIEATGSQVLSQVLRLMLPRFLQQLGKDYRAWASGDESRQALGTGEL